MSDVLGAQMARLFASFPLKDGKQYDELTVASYADRLGLIPPDYLPAVIDRVLDTHQYPNIPTIGEVKGAYMTLALGSAMPAGQALRWAMSQVGRIGGYTANGAFIEPKYPDPVVREAMQRFSWDRLSRADPNDKWLDTEFHRIYAEAREAVGQQVMGGELVPPPLALPEPANRPALKVVGR